MNSQTIIVLVIALGAGVGIWYLSNRPASVYSTGMPPIIPDVPNPNKPASSQTFNNICGYAATVAAASQGVPVPPQAGAALCAAGAQIVSSVKQALGFDQGTNCSVAQQPSAAAWCRQKFGYASAPGSDAWASGHGQRPLMTGPGSS